MDLKFRDYHSRRAAVAALVQLHRMSGAEVEACICTHEGRWGYWQVAGHPVPARTYAR